MLCVWEDKMRALLCLLLASCVAAEKNDNRRNKLPFIADAVGNSLPRPSSVPATVGSPVNLLTPDRYEFYTFDESGELVKRLMTLEEIQAIVAAGEEAEGLVTFANENQPTVSFNMNQPPYTKVHSVVTNVQNVLKAQMEAHKNKPHIQPTLDTPDVSDSWSLILPSIFGNTGVDIVFDKNSGSVTPPETDTYENNSEEEEDLLSKEGSNEVVSSSTSALEEKHAVTEKIPSKEEIKEVPTTSSTTTTTTTTTITTTTTPKTTTTTRKPTTTTRKATTTTKKPTTTSQKPSTTTQKPTTTTQKPTTTTQKPTTTTTKAPTTTTTTTKKPIVTSTTTTQQPTTASTSNNPSTTTSLPLTKVTNKPQTTTTSKPTTAKTVLQTSTAKPEVSTKKNSDNILSHQDNDNVSTTDKAEIQFEKISTFIPVSTVNYITDRISPKPEVTTKSPSIASTTKGSTVTTTTTNSPSTEATKTETFATTSNPVVSTSNYILNTVKENESDKINVTTITTQSVSPSTTVSSTEFASTVNVNDLGNQPNDEDNDNEKDDETLLPLFDVAQSISQIASDLGGSYQPIPTTSNLLDTTKVNLLDLESKEVLDMDIPSGPGNDTSYDNDQKLNSTDNSTDNFIKISTFDPHDKNDHTKTNETEIEAEETEKFEIKPTNVKSQNTKESSQTVRDNTKNNNVIINNIKQVEFMTTTATSEETTIDPVLSESMGDLLSQVVNEAPQSMVNPNQNVKEDAKASTTEKNIEITTAAAAGLKTTPEISHKVKEEATSTTEATDIQLHKTTATEKPDITNFTVNTLSLSNDKKDTESVSNESSGSNVNPSDSKITESNKLDKDDDKTQNFVQISISSSKNDLKVNDTNEIKNSLDLTQEKPTEINNIVKRDPEKIESNGKNGNKTTVTETKQFESVETISKPIDSIIPTTTIAPNKITQSKFNNINVGDKTNKNSEPLPKVDDFKKKIQKVNDEEELVNERNNSWKLVPTLSPPKVNEIPKDKLKSETHFNPDSAENKDVVLEFSTENQGLEVTTRDLGEDVTRFSELSNELAFRFWNVMIDDIDKRRSFVLSPYSVFSMLAMIFMGARGATSGEMNEILKLDDMVTFNPHFTLKNISDSIETTPESGVAISAFIRELYSDRNKGKILTFYKERAQHFYNGHVEEINFKLISDIIRRRTNLLVKRYTWGKVPEYMKTNNIVMQTPLAAFTANIFQTDCSGTSVDGRDGEMYFVVSPNVRQRRLVPVPAVVYKSGFLAGYDPSLDVTVAALGNTNTIVSTMFLMPGQQGNVVHADDLEKLEERLLDAIPTTPTWNRVLRSLLPRTGLELQIPRFSHKSTFNISSSLKKMGLKDLFDGDHADLGGLNGPSKDLYLSDMVQLNTFATCGEGAVGEQHHIEEYPDTLSVSQRRRTRWLNDWDEPRDYQRAFHDPHDVGDAMHLPLHLRPRQARVPARSSQPARLKFDRPFLYFVRHNPSGMILYFGRFNPRLLP